MSVLASPVNVPKMKLGGKHAARRNPLWVPFDALLALVGLALVGLRKAPQTDPDATQEVPSAVPTPNVMQAFTSALRGAGLLPPEPPKGWRGWGVRLRRWMAGWRNHETAVARLVLIREWCKTIMTMALCATFLYVCWALVDWIPA